MEVLVFLLGLFLYFLPTFIALEKGHTSTSAIFVVNLILGWTLVGWIVAVIWALTNSK